MTAYDEIPISEHKFLPIVTLGGKENKHFSWGATIPDSKGNYYYTSFGPIGFAFPYVAAKLAGMDFSERSLMRVNVFIECISLVLISLIILHLYRNSKKKIFLVIFGTCIYAGNTSWNGDSILASVAYASYAPIANLCVRADVYIANMALCILCNCICKPTYRMEWVCC